MEMISAQHSSNSGKIKLLKNLTAYAVKTNSWRLKLSTGYSLLLFAVGSRSCSECFSPGCQVFPAPQKPTLQIPIRSGNSGRRASPWHMPLQIPIYFYFLFYFFKLTPPGKVEFQIFHISKKNGRFISVQNTVTQSLAHCA